jgi:hypothetical protein
MESAAVALTLKVLESVRCLECGDIYSKPVSGGIAERNPGCPACGYVGWLPVSLPAEPESRRRSAEGRLPHRLDRSR